MDEYLENLGNDTSFMYARQSNLSGMFEHLHAVHQQREHEFGVNSIALSLRDSITTGQDRRELDLDVIEEREGDETGKYDRHDSSDLLLPDDSTGGQIPATTVKRRSTMMTEMTVFTTQHELSSDSNVGDHPPWVDRIHLRHGMDWLDLTRQEVDRDAQKMDNSLIMRKS